MCPCNYGRWGACVLTWCLVWAYQHGGIAFLVPLALAGNVIAIIWAAAAAVGVVWLVTGLREALAHDDSFDGPGLSWSVGVLALCTCAMYQHWFLLGDAPGAFISRTVWLGWAASNLFNLFLQLRGRRHAAPVPPVFRNEPRPQRFALRRSRTIKVIEEIEGRGLQQLPPEYRTAARPVSSDLIEHGGASPQIVYVKTKDGAFVPVVLPAADDPVPVKRLR
jgi:hypothetical protein